MIQSIMNGDTKSYETLIIKYEGFILQLGKKYIQDPDEMDDFLQDVFLLAYQSLSGFRGEAQFSTWIYRIARNLLKKSSKLPKNIQIEDHNKFDILPLSRNHLKNDWIPEMSILKDELQNKIRNLVSKLPNKYKIPIVLYYFDNLSYNEISNRLNLKLNTLKSYLHRGKALLKEFFHE